MNKNLNQKEHLNETKILTKNKIIYLEIDDTYSNLITKNGKNKKHCSRTLMLHLGKDKNNNLIHKTLILSISETNKKKLEISKLTKKISKIIYKIYENNYSKIVIYGNGARFIKSIAKTLNATYILNKFHIKKYVFSLVGFSKSNTKNKKFFKSFLDQNNKTLEKTVLNLIYQNEYKKDLILLENIFNKLNNHPEINFPKSKFKELKLFKKYLLNNKIALTNFNKNLTLDQELRQSFHIILRKNN
ncbi:hypothetical protein [Mycoplasmopsis cricetuli]|uniref:hypothetical protein n=1 Tax=Mycoplasmopsis cricetuli TaxID=171283 RepID=UPI00046EB715|nr:hypothetical protein [Mycoplasmopsis cricetuli]